VALLRSQLSLLSSEDF